MVKMRVLLISILIWIAIIASICLGCESCTYNPNNKIENDTIKTVLVDKQRSSMYSPVTHTWSFHKKIKLKKGDKELWVKNNQLFNDAEIGDTILIIDSGLFCTYKKQK